MRLSVIFPPHSLITRVSSWTIPVRSLPIAETAKCCFICALTVEFLVIARSVPGAAPAGDRRLVKVNCRTLPDGASVVRFKGPQRPRLPSQSTGS
jgi:hypothetical protein